VLIYVSRAAYSAHINFRIWTRLRAPILKKNSSISWAARVGTTRLHSKAMCR